MGRLGLYYTHLSHNQSYISFYQLEFMFPLAPVILPDYPAADADREVAAPDLDRLA